MLRVLHELYCYKAAAWRTARPLPQKSASEERLAAAAHRQPHVNGGDAHKGQHGDSGLATAVAGVHAWCRQAEGRFWPTARAARCWLSFSRRSRRLRTLGWTSSARIQRDLAPNAPALSGSVQVPAGLNNAGPESFRSSTISDLVHPLALCRHKSWSGSKGLAAAACGVLRCRDADPTP